MGIEIAIPQYPAKARFQPGLRFSLIPFYSSTPWSPWSIPPARHTLGCLTPYLIILYRRGCHSLT